MEPLAPGSSPAHSHPRGNEPTPGPGDNNIGPTSDTGYVITPDRAYAIDRAGNGTYRTRLLSGHKLNDQERNDLINYMRDWESGKSTNAGKSYVDRFCS